MKYFNKLMTAQALQLHRHFNLQVIELGSYRIRDRWACSISGERDFRAIFSVECRVEKCWRSRALRCILESFRGGFWQTAKEYAWQRHNFWIDADLDEDAERFMSSWWRYIFTLQRVLSRSESMAFTKLMYDLNAGTTCFTKAFRWMQLILVAHPALIPGYNELQLCGPWFKAYTGYQIVFGRLLISVIFHDHALALQILLFMITWVHLRAGIWHFRYCTIFLFYTLDMASAHGSSTVME